MIITILCFALLVISFVLFCLGKKSYLCDNLSVIFGVTGFLGTIVCATIIIISHVGTCRTIRDNQFTYEKIMKQIEIINSDYEDVSKTNVIDEVYELNRKVDRYIYWNSNPWTSWFYDDKVVKELKYIDRLANNLMENEKEKLSGGG